MALNLSSSDPVLADADVRIQRRVQSEILHASDVPSLPSIVYASLHKEILTGKIRPGAVLRQETIAERLGVSRLPVREALARLEAEGLVLSRPRRGYVVAPVDIDDVQEIYDLRAMLEEKAGALAAQKRSQDDIAAVLSILNDMDGMTISNTEDVSRFLVRNRNFHARIFTCSGRVHTCRVLQSLSNNIERYIQVGTWMVGTLDYGHVDHRHIFNAFRHGDAVAMATLCREHVLQAAQRLMAAMKEKHPVPVT